MAVIIRVVLGYELMRLTRCRQDQIRLIDCLIGQLIDFQMRLGAWAPLVLLVLCSFVPRQAVNLGMGITLACDTHGPSVGLAARRTCLGFPGIALAVSLGNQYCS